MKNIIMMKTRSEVCIEKVKDLYLFLTLLFKFTVQENMFPCTQTKTI